MAQTLVFDVKGMTCDNCVHHVTEAAQAVPGVTSAKVDLATNTAEIQGEFQAGQVVAALQEEGYEAAVRS
ncbi:MAG: heavy-metal-associated domain-containing protein [Dehalococcoidia bacterium]|nr:heavy-metal-associated domain-containing protein [Dehalococcoidia bacterium]